MVRVKTRVRVRHLLLRARRVADVCVDELAHDLEDGVRDADGRDGIPCGRNARVLATLAEG